MLATLKAKRQIQLFRVSILSLPLLLLTNLNSGSIIVQVLSYSQKKHSSPESIPSASSQAASKEKLFLIDSREQTRTVDLLDF